MKTVAIISGRKCTESSMKDKKKEDDVKKVKKSLIGAPSETRAPAGQNLKADDATVKKDTVKANTQPSKEQSKEAPKQMGKPPDGKKENQESKEKPQDGRSAEKNQKDKPKDVLKVEQKPSKDRVTTERRTTATRDTKETKESMERAEREQ
ncbi:hypothetical protein Q1695_007122 [Nippostrongylus brasiliensis]|nr:hypothetical protein Q1695_007122 [Nippostrongylus brasiliensis]